MARLPSIPPIIAAMLSAIKHRGPDDQGSHIDGGVGIGIRRLSIIDLPGGHQPIANEDESIHVCLQRRVLQFYVLAQRARRAGASV